jgi:hypothetical protein
MEASGHARWFERLLSELQFELWIDVFQGVRNDEYIGLRDGMGAEGDFPRDLAHVPPDFRLEPFSAGVDEAN